MLMCNQRLKFYAGVSPITAGANADDAAAMQQLHRSPLLSTRHLLPSGFPDGH